MNEKSEALREQSKALINSIMVRQNILREQLEKMKNSSSKQQSAVVKTVSFRDFPEHKKVVNAKFENKIKAKSESSLNHHETKADSLSDLNELKSDYSDFSENASDVEIESENLVGLIRSKEIKTLERLKATNENEFLKHVEAKRQEYLKRDYSENDSDMNNAGINVERQSRRKKINLKVKKSKNEQRRSKSAPSYLRPTEASQEKTRKKSPKAESRHDVKNKNAARNQSCEEKLKRNKFRDTPLLGLDFVLDSLTTKSSKIKSQKPEEYWQELFRFREENKNECFSSKPINFDGTTSSLFSDLSHLNLKHTDSELEDGINHRCIHSYTLNERLFPVPVYKDKNGQSICPVCKSPRKEGSFFAPQFCKVSIPNYRLVEPISIKPCRKSSPKAENTLSLAEHCVAGYQNGLKKSARSYQAPPSKNIDLKSSTINYKELNMKKPLTSTDLKLIEENRDPATAGIYSKANAMRYELEDQHLKRLKELIPEY